MLCLDSQSPIKQRQGGRQLAQAIVVALHGWPPSPALPPSPPCAQAGGRKTHFEVQENFLRGAPGTEQEELGAAPSVLWPHGACCTVTPRSPHTFQLPPHQRFAVSPAPGHICTSPPRPLPGEGGEQALLCERWEHWDQGSSIVYYQYLSWLGGTACWRKRGRGRAPNILCIPDNQSKGSAVAPVLGGNVRPFVCTNPAIKYPGVRFSNKWERGASVPALGKTRATPSSPKPQLKDFAQNLPMMLIQTQHPQLTALAGALALLHTPQPSCNSHHCDAGTSCVPRHRWKTRDRTETRCTQGTSRLARSARSTATLSSKTSFQTQLLKNEATSADASCLPNAAGSQAPSRPLLPRPGAGACLQAGRPNSTSVLGQIRRFGGGSARALRSGGWSRTKCAPEAEQDDL